MLRVSRPLALPSSPKRRRSAQAARERGFAGNRRRNHRAKGACCQEEGQEVGPETAPDTSHEHSFEGTDRFVQGLCRSWEVVMVFHDLASLFYVYINLIVCLRDIRSIYDAHFSSVFPQTVVSGYDRTLRCSCKSKSSRRLTQHLISMYVFRRLLSDNAARHHRGPLHGWLGVIPGVGNPGSVLHIDA